MKTILAPIDFSTSTEAVVAQAATLAKALAGRIVLLSVVQPPVITSEYAPLMDSLGEIAAAAEKATAERLESHRQALQQAGIATETVQLHGAPIPHVLEQAAKFAADYIVMGSHGHTALYDLLVGSTTHGVLLRATCPVVIVRAAKR
jgi:nucleotide-binding universal stress UspA family protein